jgi:hypothetical protein
MMEQGGVSVQFARWLTTDLGRPQEPMCIFQTREFCSHGRAVPFGSSVDLVKLGGCSNGFYNSVQSVASVIQT